jgi:2-keto-3-deoxy-L-fuconate dehydrogenase
MHPPLAGKRILLTHADEFVGPTLHEVLAGQGAEVITQTGSLAAPGAPAKLIAETGRVDILIAHLSHPAATTPVSEVADAEWSAAFDELVHPLPRLVRAVLPQMTLRKAGKIIVVGSAAGLRGQSRASTYSAARGAQLAYAQAAGVELARAGIQLNATAFHFVDTPSYFPPALKANPKFQERLKREVPLGRMVAATEAAQFIAYLCSDAAGCFVGQVFPVNGGWLAR